MRPVEAAIILFVTGSSALAQQPLSAIDWLNDPVSTPVAQPRVTPLDEPPVSDTASVPDVEVLPLGAMQADAVGLLPSHVTGLPVDLWAQSETATLTDAFGRLPAEPLPALQALYYSLLLAEADPPHDAGSDAAFLKARVSALRSFGAVEPARALLERAGADRKALFDPWLDLSLIAGAEDAPCARLSQDPTLTESYAARIYCIARAGDWRTAALTYETALALDILSPEESTLLAQFLDPELIEEAPALPAGSAVSPLIFRLHEAVGNPLPTRRLPRAFAMADLRGTAGWKSSIEAAERLTQTSALPATRLLGLYTEREPAASGGVWDRVAAVQKFDAALAAGDDAQIAETLPPAWDAMREINLEIAFSQLFSDALNDRNFSGEALDIAIKTAMLSPDYEDASRTIASNTPSRAFMTALARGAPSASQAGTPIERAIAAAFASARPAPEDAEMIRAGELGRAILSATLRLDQAGKGNPDIITQSLATLRAVGLEDTARRAALQLLLLER